MDDCQDFAVMNAASVIAPMAFLGALVFAAFCFSLQSAVLDQLRKNMPADLRDEIMLRTALQGHIWLPGISRDIRRKYVLLLVCGCAFCLCVATMITAAGAGWPVLIFWCLSLFAVAMTIGTTIKHRDQLL